MALTLDKSNGTLTSTTGEQNLKQESSSGIYILYVNLRNVADGDQFALRAYLKLLTGDAQSYMLWEDVITNSQGDGADVGASALGDVLYKFPPIESPYLVTWTLKKLAGTNRDFPWREDQIA